MKTRNVGIYAVGAYVPDNEVTNSDLAQRMDTSDAWITKKLGIRTRRYADPDEQTSDLALNALQDACLRGNISLDSIDLIVGVSNSPDQSLPGLACLVMQKAGMSGIAAFDVGAPGCAGAVYSVDVAAQYVATGRANTVAVVQADALSKLLDHSDPRDRTTGVIFADGAACWILRPTKDDTGILHGIHGTDPSGYSKLGIVVSGTQDHPDRTDDRALRIQMDGPFIWNFTHEHVPQLLKNLAHGIDVSLDDVDLFALHQANLHIVHDALTAVGQPLSKTVTNVEHYGNTSVASVGLVLSNALDQGKLTQGDLVFAAAFGAGLSYSALAIRWCGPDDFVT